MTIHPCQQENFQKLRNRFKDAQHVKNVEGIGNAHKRAGELAKTEMVYIVDADADITGHFSFDFIPEKIFLKTNLRICMY